MTKTEYMTPQAEAVDLQMELMNTNSPQIEKPQPGGNIDPWGSGVMFNN
ncbi:MAG: hypothetical protein IJ623_05515 [Bacteroidales bacterium]|nr:hypothetical protein [Bacteroidales bacterium]